MSDVKMKRDPGLNRRMNEPHESRETGNAALQAFFEEVAAAREKHRIADVYVVTMQNVVFPSGEGPALATMHLGNILNSELMCSYALGRERRSREERLAKILGDDGDDE